MHEIIALGQRLRRARRPAPKVVSLARIDAARFVALVKAPAKSLDHRAGRLIARATARLEDTTRLGVLSAMDKPLRRAHKAAKLRLFRLWKVLEPALLADAPTRPFAEHIAWLRRSRSRRL